MLWILIPIALLGLTLLFLGIRGRVGGGTPRRRSWRLSVIGVGLTLPMVSFFAIASQSSAWTGWNATKPGWVLELDARFGTRSIQTHAAAELIGRSQDNRFSEDAMQRLSTLAASQIGRGADANLEWYGFAVEARNAGKISDEQWAAINDRMIKVGKVLFEKMEFRTDVWFHGSRRQSDFTLEGFTHPSVVQFAKPVQLLYVLESVSVEGQPIALVNRSARERENGMRAKGITYIEALGWNYYTLEPIQDGPDWRVVVKRRSNWLGHEMSEGITIDDLSIGEYTATATWQAYIVIGPLGVNIYNTPTAPAFGPFEVTKEYQYTIR